MSDTDAREPRDRPLALRLWRAAQQVVLADGNENNALNYCANLLATTSTQ